MLSERLEGKKKDGTVKMAFKEATGDLKANHRGAQAVTSYVAFADYNFVTCLINS
jgi:hypothetical protein